MRLKTLGQLELEGSSFTRKKPLLLLTYLVLEGPQERHHLAELFWPEAAEPMTSLRVALAQLRKAAAGVIARDDAYLEATVESDLEPLLNVLDQQQVGDIEALYAAPFLDGFYLREIGSELEEWIYSTREHLAERVRHVLLNKAEAVAAQGEFGAAAEKAEQAFTLPGALEPDPETLRRFYLVMMAGGSHEVGQVREAAASYGVTLAATCEQAQERLGKTKQRDRRPLRHNLPALSTSFVGRDPELVELAGLLAEPDCRLLSVLGPGGIGKTRFALRAAHEQVEQGSFRDGVFFVPLEALREAAAIPAGVAQALGLALSEHDDSRSALLEYLSDRQLLLVLDNVEHLLEGVDVIAEMLAACAQLKVLVTSRERLNLEPEWVMTLEGLPTPEAASDQDAHHHEAVQLFQQRARKAQPRFILNQDTLPHVISICQRLAGIPLALELAAAWTKLMPVAEIAKQVQDNLDFVASPARDRPDRHRSLRATFAYSWRLLSPKEQAALRKLSVLRSSFTRRAASLVVGATIPTLASLVDKSLIRLLPGGRYDRHPLLYQYMREKLGEYPEDEKCAHVRLTEYCLDLAQEVAPTLLGADQPRQLERLTLEHPHFQTTLDWLAAEQMFERGARLANTLYWFWHIRGHFAEGRRYFRIFINGSLPDDVRAEALWHMSSHASSQGDFAEAQALTQESLELYRSLDDPVGIARALWQLGCIRRDQQQLDDASHYLYEAERWQQQSGDRFGLSMTYNDLGIVHAYQGDYAAAAHCFERCLELKRELGDLQGIAYALGNLAELNDLAGDDPARVRETYHEILVLEQQLGDRRAIARCYLRLTRLALRGEAWQRAREHLSEALPHALEVGEKTVVFELLDACCELLAKQRRWDALSCITAALTNLSAGFEVRLPRGWQTAARAYQESARTELDEASLAAQRAQGMKMSLRELVVYAQGVLAGGENTGVSQR